MPKMKSDSAAKKRFKRTASGKFKRRKAFRSHLRRTKIFVASHHGRRSGYCKEVFDHCTPSCVIFSDSDKVHATQDTTSLYQSHATGVSFNGKTRYVLTTRNVGTFWFNG